MDFRYTDPRGRSSGPYLRSELKSLWARGLLEPGGRIELVTGVAGWSVAEVPWLDGEGTADPVGGSSVPAPTAAPITPPTSSEEALARAVPEPASAGTSGCTRIAYILLAVLLPFIGIFGVHNIVAGYTVRGWLALAVSVITVFGIGCMVFPCSCVALPAWIALFILSVVEAITVTADAAGRPFG